MAKEDFYKILGVKRDASEKEIRRIATDKAQKAQLLLLTSFEAYRELRGVAGLSQAEVTKTLQALLR